MVDHTAFSLRPRTEATRRKKLELLLQDAQKDLPWGNGRMFIHGLDDQDFTVSNSSQATADRIKKLLASIVNFKMSDAFNVTLKNLDYKSLLLVGFLIQVDHKTTSPNTDAADLDLDLDLRLNVGGPTMTWDAKTPTRLRLELQSVKLALEDGEAEEFAGPFVIPVGPQGVPIYKTEQTNVMLGGQAALEITGGTAHTVTTTYTFTMHADAILVDEEAFMGTSEQTLAPMLSEK